MSSNWGKLLLCSMLLVLAAGCSDDPPPPLPALSASYPAEGDTIARTAWLVLTFAEAPPSGATTGIHLTCDGDAWDVDVDALDGTTFVVNPRRELPGGARCRLHWQSTSGAEEIPFTTAAVGMPAVALYDRDDPTLFTPFPDDVWLTEADTPTGRQVAIAAPDRPGDVLVVLNSLIHTTEELDGFSPAAPLVVSLDAAPDPASLPQTLEASLHPLSTVMLFDVARASPTYGQRVPIHVLARSELNADGTTDHVLIVFPGPLLETLGQYALVVTRRVLADPTRPLEATPFLRHAMTGATGTAAEAAVAHVLAPVMTTLAHDVTPPLRDDDIALVHRFSIRSDFGIPDDLLSVRAQLSGHPPSFKIRAVEPSADPDVAAVVTGTWRAPQFRDGDFFARDTDGLPRFTGYVELPFILTLPAAAQSGQVPITMYQHGTPGSAEREVPITGRGALGEAGFAVIGYTDIPNREIIQSGPEDQLGQYIFEAIVFEQRVPEMNQTLNTAEQLAFIQVIQAMDGLDVLPIGAPDGLPEIDASAITYLGISQGSERGVNLLPYAPEIRAAALVVDGGRASALLVHQQSDALYLGTTELLPNLRRSELYAGLALFQMGGDNADPVMHARFLYDGRLDLGADGARASVLMTEGLLDSMIPPFSTQAAAAEMGLPHLAPWPRPVPYLEQTSEALSGNIAPDTTGGFAQFVPKGVPDVPETPGCEFEFEGHFCPQSAPGAVAQRIAFFTSALEGTAVIEPAD